MELIAGGNVPSYTWMCRFSAPFPRGAEGHAASWQPAEDAGAHPRLARDLPGRSAIRSTLDVGFPGETEEDFAMLLDWLDEAKLDRVGAFEYEPVKGSGRQTISDLSWCPRME